MFLCLRSGSSAKKATERPWHRPKTRSTFNPFSFSDFRTLFTNVQHKNFLSHALHCSWSCNLVSWRCRRSWLSSDKSLHYSFHCFAIVGARFWSGFIPRWNAGRGQNNGFGLNVLFQVGPSTDQSPGLYFTSVFRMPPKPEPSGNRIGIMNTETGSRHSRPVEDATLAKMKLGYHTEGWSPKIPR